jgi:hypothetical protein
MEPDLAALAGRVLEALADLAPEGEARRPSLAVPTDWFRWLSAESVRLFPPPILGSGHQDNHAIVDSAFGNRLAAVDQVRIGQRSLRAGWLFVAGRMPGTDGRPHRVFQPLVTVPVRVRRHNAFGGASLVPAGDAELTELITDREVRFTLERDIPIGGGALEGVRDTAIPSALITRLDTLAGFARAAAAAAGLPATHVVPAQMSPDALMRTEPLVIVAGVGVYAIQAVVPTGRAGSLRAWRDEADRRWTAFHSIYLGAPAPSGATDPAEPVQSAFLLNPTQRRAVLQSRHEPVSLLSGPPGTGKTHTVVAIACDALARGDSVLVAAKSEPSVDAVLDLLERAPGPRPVVFGSNERRDALAAQLAAGQLAPVDADEVGRLHGVATQARRARDALAAAIADELAAEALVDASTDGDLVDRVLAPGLFDPGADLARVQALVDACANEPTGWWSRRRWRRSWVELRSRSHCADDVDATEVRRLLRQASAQRLASGLVARGGLDLDARWPQLRDLDDRDRDTMARWLAAETRSSERLDRTTLPAVAALATALRSGRAARRDQLRRLDDKGLTRALPLWIGSLPDVDDLLPPIAGLFDLVVLDEASCIDQPLAASALLRGKRAVIVGDPQQLRHVSFLSDAQMQSVVEAHGLGDTPTLAARLDARRNSTFDVAAGAAPVVALDEHFRSDPHLVEFVARHLYGDRVKIATRRPSTDSTDCIDVVRVDGTRDSAGVVAAEITWIVRRVKELRREGARSVGLVSPFRAQADALEDAVLEAFDADALESLDLRVGTVHAFQGNERDVIIASLGLGPDDAASWRFVEDPHLFAVFVSRARRHLTLVVSAEPPEGGLMAGFLAQADAPPGPRSSTAPQSPWAAGIAIDLARSGLRVTPAYESGRHCIDVCVASGGRDVAIDCGVHPDGPAAHIERRLSLMRSGWDVLDAFPSRWRERRGELIVELARTLGAGP